MARPRKPQHEKYRTPVRQLGRVDDETWQLLTSAAKDAGMTFTAWSVSILTRAAKRSAAKPPTLVIGEKQRPRARRSSSLGG